jgi:predicted aldo/keto reductase-like oxidoreductase
MRQALQYVHASVEERQSTPLREELKEWLRGQCVWCEHCLPCPQDIRIPMVIYCLDYVEFYSGTRASEQYNRELYASLAVKASDCIECEVCLERCPFDVDIIGKMCRAAEVFDTVAQ